MLTQNLEKGNPKKETALADSNPCDIPEDQIPFEIPENWCWCRIDDIFAHNSGKALNKTGNKEGIELEYITTSNLYWNYFELNNLKTMLFKDSEIEKCTVLKGDLLICEGGDVGRGRVFYYGNARAYNCKVPIYDGILQTEEFITLYIVSCNQICVFPR